MNANKYTRADIAKTIAEAGVERVNAAEFVGKLHNQDKTCYNKQQAEGDMARYRTTDVAAGQGLFLSVNLQEQLLPDSFEYMLNEIIGTKIDLSVFDKKYKNDQSGAGAVSPSVLLKLIVYGYHNGCISSRKIYELNNTRACSHNVNL